MSVGPRYGLASGQSIDDVRRVLGAHGYDYAISYACTPEFAANLRLEKKPACESGENVIAFLHNSRLGWTDFLDVYTRGDVARLFYWDDRDWVIDP